MDRDLSYLIPFCIMKKVTVWLVKCLANIFDRNELVLLVATPGLKQFGPEANTFGEGCLVNNI